MKRALYLRYGDKNNMEPGDYGYVVNEYGEYQLKKLDSDGNKIDTNSDENKGDTMEERNRITSEELSNSIEKIYSLILKIEEKIDDQKQHLRCIFDRIGVLERRTDPSYAEIIALNKK